MSIFGKPAEPKDVELANIQSDSVSAIAWSPVADLLAVASWNNEVSRGLCIAPLELSS